MSKTLAQLLGNNHPLFTFNLEQLEKASGGDSISSRLVGDMIEAAHTLMRRLQLDPSDTSPRELYQALLEASKRPDAAAMFKQVDFVLVQTEGEVISFNLYDLIESAHHHLAFESRLLDHGQRRLRAEIIKRFAASDQLDNQIVKKIAAEIDVHRTSDSHYEHVDQLLLTQGDTRASAKPSFLAIGDIFTDAFIKLDEQYSVVETDSDGKEWLKLPFGSKPPYEHADIVRSVGPSPNAAVSCARLGLDVSLMAWLGDDEAGKHSLAHLRAEGIDTSAMITEEGSASSYWYVLRHGTDRTMLVKSETYKYEWCDPAAVPDWLYLAYIGKDSWEFHEGLERYLNEHPTIKFVLQPATYHFEWGTEKLAGLYKRAYMVVMNREEAEQVTGQAHDDIAALAQGLHDLGPSIAVITDGSHGSYVSHDGKIVTIPNYPDPAPPTDRTGAGDAFASTLTAGLAYGKSIDEALRWAPVNSASVVQQLGAQRGLLRLDELEEWLEKAPSDYLVTEL